MICDKARAIPKVPPTSPRPGFSSFKNPVPIVYPRRWHRDLLIQLVLDPAVMTMEPTKIAGLEFCVTVRTAVDVRRLIAIDAGREISEPTPAGSIKILRSTVFQQPRLGTARMAWAARGRPIPAGDRLRILMAVEAHKEGVTVGNIVAASQSSPAEQAEAILALACEGLLTIDLASPFSPSTRVRRVGIGEGGADVELALLR